MHHPTAMLYLLAALATTTQPAASAAVAAPAPRGIKEVVGVLKEHFADEDTPTRCAKGTLSCITDGYCQQERVCGPDFAAYVCSARQKCEIPAGALPLIDLPGGREAGEEEKKKKKKKKKEWV